jgi:hypothetical protein
MSTSPTLKDTVFLPPWSYILYLVVPLFFSLKFAEQVEELKHEVEEAQEIFAPSARGEMHLSNLRVDIAVRCNHAFPYRFRML